MNRIEILWKHAKHFWRWPIGLTGTALREEVDSFMRSFGTQFTIKFAEVQVLRVSLAIKVDCLLGRNGHVRYVK